SHGETWSFALALRLGSLELFRSDGIEPALPLDDVFAELDGHPRARPADVAAGAEQVGVTAAVAEGGPAAPRGTRHDVVMTGEGADRHSGMTASRPSAREPDNGGMTGDDDEDHGRREEPDA